MGLSSSIAPASYCIPPFAIMKSVVGGLDGQTGARMWSVWTTTTRTNACGQIVLGSKSLLVWENFSAQKGITTTRTVGRARQRRARLCRRANVGCSDHEPMLLYNCKHRLTLILAKRCERVNDWLWTAPRARRQAMCFDSSHRGRSGPPASFLLPPASYFWLSGADIAAHGLAG